MFRGTYVVVSSVLRTRTYSSFKFSHPSYTSMVHYTTNISDEITKARSTKNRPVVTIFDQIINRELSANIIYEDDKCMAFTDVNPQAPTHILVIPKRHISMLSQAKDADKKLLGHLLLVARQVGNENTTNGYRIVINDGPDGCQSIYYLHLHVLGGRQMNWPPG